MGRFQIGKFDVDVSRCRVSSGDYEVVLEPKVMDVLQYLFRHKGEVVSQEQLFESVWPGSTFNPSSVQRCIALLRKALQEDSKNATFIITHPKRGYSLELPHDSTEHYRYWRWASMLFMGLVIIATAWFFTPSSSVKMNFTGLLPVTSNEANESYLSLSPSGKYLAFVRGDDSNKNIWLRELASGREVNLTHQASAYHSLGWNPEGSALAYMEDTDEQRILSYLSLDPVSMTLAGQTFIRAFPIFHVTSGKLQWHTNNRLYFVETNKNESDTRLSYVDLADKSKHSLIQAQGQDWVKTLALSPDEKTVALGYEMGLNRYRIDLIDLATLTAMTLIQIEDSIQGLSWHPDGKSLLISNRSRLQVVDLKGSLSEIDFNNYKFVRDAQFNKAGTKIFMELVNVDVDILRKTTTSPDTFETLIDTSSLDFLPVFSPDDSRFVFQSHRTGIKQLYVYENGQQRMVFANPDDEELFGMVWTPDGTEVITGSKDKLFRINISEASFITIPHQHQPFGLREHFNHENALLVSYRTDEGGNFHLAKLDMNTMQLTTYEAEGKRLVCYSMALNTDDHIYVANSKEVFRIQPDDNGSFNQERLWTASEKYISGLRVKGNKLSLRLDSDNNFELVTVDIDSGAKELIYQGTEHGDMLINTSHDEQQFLYLSKPERTRQLVRLE